MFVPTLLSANWTSRKPSLNNHLTSSALKHNPVSDQLYAVGFTHTGLAATRATKARRKKATLNCMLELVVRTGAGGLEC